MMKDRTFYTESFTMDEVLSLDVETLMRWHGELPDVGSCLIHAAWDNFSVKHPEQREAHRDKWQGGIDGDEASAVVTLWDEE